MQTSGEKMSAGWVPLDVEWWADSYHAIPAPWPRGLALFHLRWLSDRVHMGRRPKMPGRPALRRLWGWTDHQVRVLLKCDEWASPVRADRQPIASPSPARRQPIASPSPAATSTKLDNDAETASPSPARRQPVASPSPADLHTRVGDRGQRTEGRNNTPPKAPHTTKTKPPPPSPTPSVEGLRGEGPQLSMTPPREQDSEPKADRSDEVSKWAKAAKVKGVKPSEVQAGVVRVMTAVLGKPVKPARQATSAKSILGLWRSSGSEWPEFIDDLLMVVAASKTCQARQFSRDIRAEDWLDGVDRSRDIATLCVRGRWPMRLDLAEAHHNGSCACPQSSPDGLTYLQREERRQREAAEAARVRPPDSEQALATLHAAVADRKARRGK